MFGETLVCDMFCAMLEMNSTFDQFGAYSGTAKMPWPELEKIRGSVHDARYSSLTRRRWMPSLSRWRDEKLLMH
jgi:hypothetical protein